MASETTYTCDSCGATSKAATKLRRERVWLKLGEWVGPTTEHVDLCSDCCKRITAAWRALMAAMRLPEMPPR